MTEKDKLMTAAEDLGFDECLEPPAIIGLPSGHACQVHAKEGEEGKSFYLDKPSQIQCAAMRAVMYFWKVLRLVEAIVTEDADLNSHVLMRFEAAEVELDLPDEMRGGVVTPVRVVANLILGRLNDEAIQTRGTMGVKDEEEITQKRPLPLPDDLA
jgi:hypothetical protein